jgi:hypothetical protein
VDAGDTTGTVMTRNESFKRRIRARMAATGEKYGAARRVLLEQAASRAGRDWASEPEQSDDVIRANTGRGWDEWCRLIDDWPGHTDGRRRRELGGRAARHRRLMGAERHRRLGAHHRTRSPWHPSTTAEPRCTSATRSCPRPRLWRTGRRTGVSEWLAALNHS